MYNYYNHYYNCNACIMYTCAFFGGGKIGNGYPFMNSNLDSISKASYTCIHVCFVEYFRF